MSDAPQGQRFSQIYLRPSSLLPDSKRMRMRLIYELLELGTFEFDRVVLRELGIHIRHNGVSHQWRQFLEGCEIRDVLDVVTLYWQHDPGTFSSNQRAQRRTRWVAAVRRIFAEEAVQYRVDDLGGVHFAVDAEFERSRAATIAGLGSSRYGNAAEQFESAHRYLDAVPPNGKHAVRAVFTSAEGLFRLMSGEAILGKSEIERYLQPRINAACDGDTPARVASTKMLAAFQDWIAACHQYRHEPGTEEPVQPPLGLAILLVSQGAAFIRWLVEMDQGRSS